MQGTPGDHQHVESSIVLRSSVLVDGQLVHVVLCIVLALSSVVQLLAVFNNFNLFIHTPDRQNESRNP